MRLGRARYRHDRVAVVSDQPRQRHLADTGLMRGRDLAQAFDQRRRAGEPLFGETVDQPTHPRCVRQPAAIVVELAGQHPTGQWRVRDQRDAEPARVSRTPLRSILPCSRLI